ncbi:MAG: hypothetical protein ACRDZ2_10085 [Ilumatobacteraceae bacterium]
MQHSLIYRYDPAGPGPVESDIDAWMALSPKLEEVDVDGIVRTAPKGRRHPARSESSARLVSPFLPPAARSVTQL